MKKHMCILISFFIISTVTHAQTTKPNDPNKSPMNPNSHIGRAAHGSSDNDTTKKKKKDVETRGRAAGMK